MMSCVIYIDILDEKYNVLNKIRPKKFEIGQLRELK